MFCLLEFSMSRRNKVLHNYNIYSNFHLLILSFIQFIQFSVFSIPLIQFVLTCQFMICHHVLKSLLHLYSFEFSFPFESPLSRCGDLRSCEPTGPPSSCAFNKPPILVPWVSVSSSPSVFGACLPVSAPVLRTGDIIIHQQATKAVI